MQRREIKFPKVQHWKMCGKYVDVYGLAVYEDATTTDVRPILKSGESFAYRMSMPADLLKLVEATP